VDAVDVFCAGTRLHALASRIEVGAAKNGCPGRPLKRSGPMNLPVAEEDVEL
jgi:hypothetical protein